MILLFVGGLYVQDATAEIFRTELYLQPLSPSLCVLFQQGNKASWWKVSNGWDSESLWALFLLKAHLPHWEQEGQNDCLDWWDRRGDPAQKALTFCKMASSTRFSINLLSRSMFSFFSQVGVYLKHFVCMYIRTLKIHVKWDCFNHHCKIESIWAAGKGVHQDKCCSCWLVGSCPQLFDSKLHKYLLKKLGRNGFSGTNTAFNRSTGCLCMLLLQLGWEQGWERQLLCSLSCASPGEQIPQC